MGPKELVRFADLLEDIGKNESIKAVVLAGSGTSFNVGADFDELFGGMLDITYSDWQERIIGPVTRIYLGISKMPKPVIAAIQGYAVGGGLDMALACDIRIAADNAKFGLVFVNNAINTEASTFFLPRLIGLGRSLLYSLTGELFNAQEAEKLGLVEKVVPLDQLMPETMKLAEKLANGPTMAIAAIKKLIREGLETNNLEIILGRAFDTMFRLLKTEDFREIVKAFSEKRKPVYKGR